MFVTITIIFIAVCLILFFPATFMIIFAGFRFDVAKDLIPDLTYYNYKDALTSHLHVGAVVMLSIGTIIFLGTLIITWMIVTLSKEDVIEFFQTAGIILLLLGIIVAISAPLYYIINAIVSAIINVIVSQPVPQLMTSQFNFIRLL